MGPNTPVIFTMLSKSRPPLSRHPLTAPPIAILGFDVQPGYK